MAKRPEKNEFHEFYQTYVGIVPAGDALATLVEQERDLSERLGRLDAAGASSRYAPGKWSVKEVLGHIIDTERVFTYRALTIGRGDSQPLPGMDQDLFAAGSNVADRDLAEILEEYQAVRRATLTLFRSYDEPILARVGNASGFAVTVRALVFIVAGHERHHLGVLAEKYGV
ncbi:MAG: DinB family protein [Thermoanaerobaculia bacterium]|nr:DinB family protein [Thermoanaerobaculia bacterium]